MKTTTEQGQAVADTSEVRAMFDDVIAKTTDPDVRATRELLREYFTNEDFRKQLGVFLHE